MKASDAKKLAEKNANSFQDILERIKMKAEKGLFVLYRDGKMKEGVEEKLIKNGYKIKHISGGFSIIWE